jgi:hypothetical protein
MLLIVTSSCIYDRHDAEKANEVSDVPSERSERWAAETKGYTYFFFFYTVSATGKRVEKGRVILYPI